METTPALLEALLLIYTLIIPFFVNTVWQEHQSRTFLRFYFGRPRTYNILLWSIRLVICSFSLVWYFGCVLLELFFEYILWPIGIFIGKILSLFNCKRKTK